MTDTTDLVQRLRIQALSAEVAQLWAMLGRQKIEYETELRIEREAHAAEIERLTAERDALRTLLQRYRDETPLGHQPHMIAHVVDTALGRDSIDAARTGSKT